MENSHENKNRAGEIIDLMKNGTLTRIAFE